jgi:hypothetical protein
MMHFDNFIKIVFTSVIVLLSSHQIRAETFTRAQVLEDIDFMVKTLKRVHPNLYAHRKPKEFNAVVKSVRGSVKTQETYYSVLPVFQKILATVCDEHTGVKLNGLQDLKRLHHKYYFSDRLVATKNEIFIGQLDINGNRQKLESINGRTSDEIQKFLRETNPADGCSNQETIIGGHLPPLHKITLSEFLKINGNYISKVHSPDDKLSHKYLSNAQNINAVFSNFSDQLQVNFARMELLKKHGILHTSPYSHTSSGSNDLGIVVKSNAQKTVYYIYSYSFLGGKKQMKKTNTQLREMIGSKPQYVILDLTENPGGRLQVASHLLSYFLDKPHTAAATVRMKNIQTKKPRGFTYSSVKERKTHRRAVKSFRSARKKNGQYTLKVRKTAFGNPDYKGTLTVLVSPQTHSGGTVVASVLKRKRNAKLIGYLDAGSTKTSCFGADGYYQLPNTKVTVNIPDTCYDRPRNTNQNGTKLEPDIVIDPLAGSSLHLNTRILEAALEDIAKTGQ